MNLAIDIGNTRTKIGVFSGDQLLHKEVWEKWSLREIQQLATNQKVKKVILSTVGGRLDKIIEQFLEEHFFFVPLNLNTHLPVTNAYKTPETLGKDRLAAVVGAFALYPDSNCLVIDAGTCITYDFLRHDAVYLGGNIAPGLRLRLKAMHTFTASLPELELGEVDELIGTSTEHAMRNGAQLGALMELEAFIRAFESEFGALKVILTGGDAIFFAKKMKREIFVNHNLVLTGLNKILNYNVERLE